MAPQPYTCLGFCFLLTLSTVKADDSNLSDGTVTPSLNNSLGSEEMKYVRLECEGFAAEDNISIEQHSAYIENCVTELSAAVQRAMDELEEPPEAVEDEFNEGV